MKFYVIQRKNDKKYLLITRATISKEDFGTSFANAYVFDSIATPAKGMLRKGERAVEVEQVWRKVKK